MDDRHFDALTRSLAIAQSRRGLFKVLGGALAAGFSGTLAAGVVAARCSKDGETCDETECCNKLTCVNGSCCPAERACGNGCCAAGSVCEDGRCAPKGQASCPDGQGRCDGACTDLATTANCGSCGNVCPAPADPCLIEACLNGVCGFAPFNEGGSCNDGNLCTQTDFCQNGVCVGTDPVVCPDPDQCHDPGVCDPASGLCSNPARTDGTLCSDGNECTMNDSCQGGTCVGQVVSCDDGLSCTTDSCNPVSGCVHTLQAGFCLIGNVCIAAGERNPANPCQGCDPALTPGAWANLPLGTSCADDDRCDGDEACDGAGACQPGIAVECQPPDQCHLLLGCNSETGECEYHPLSGFTCEDGDLCTTGDTCQNGVCVPGGPPGCNPIVICQQLLPCDPAVGGCHYEPLDDGALCGQGQVNACLSFQCQEGTCVEVNSCEDGLTCCNGACVDLSSNSDHCGICSRNCVTAIGFVCCDGTCTRTEFNEAHCGQCGNECGAGQECFFSTCKCGVEERCVIDGTTCCGQTCVFLDSDEAHCGQCGNECGAGELCCGGVCCGAGELCCGGVCSGDDCGVCGNVCQNDEQCVDGECRCAGVVCPGDEECIGGECRCGTEPACGASLTCCGGVCVDLNSHPNHCGGCDASCHPFHLCCEGMCFNPIATPEHCGSCEHDCSSQGDICIEDHITSPPTYFCTCGEESLFAPCPEGALCCGGDCKDATGDRFHCGGCNRFCPSGQECCDGECVPLGTCSCPAGHDYCLGACRNLSSDPGHCGSCLNACRPERPCCTNGACVEACNGSCCPVGFTCCHPAIGEPRCCPNSVVCGIFGCGF